MASKFTTVEIKTVKEANEFCDALVNQCKSLDDSKKFALVGVASYSIPYSSWGLVSVKYKSGEKIVISGKEANSFLSCSTSCSSVKGNLST